MPLLVGLMFRWLDELMKHRRNGTFFPSTVMLTSCIVEFDAPDTPIRAMPLRRAAGGGRYMTET